MYQMWTTTTKFLFQGSAVQFHKFLTEVVSDLKKGTKYRYKEPNTDFNNNIFIRQ